MDRWNVLKEVGPLLERDGANCEKNRYMWSLRKSDYRSGAQAMISMASG